MDEQLARRIGEFGSTESPRTRRNCHSRSGGNHPRLPVPTRTRQQTADHHRLVPTRPRTGHPHRHAPRRPQPTRQDHAQCHRQPSHIPNPDRPGAPAATVARPAWPHRTRLEDLADLPTPLQQDHRATASSHHRHRTGSSVRFTPKTNGPHTATPPTSTALSAPSPNASAVSTCPSWQPTEPSAQPKPLTTRSASQPPTGT